MPDATSHMKLSPNQNITEKYHAYSDMRDGASGSYICLGMSNLVYIKSETSPSPQTPPDKRCTSGYCTSTREPRFQHLPTHKPASSTMNSKTPAPVTRRTPLPPVTLPNEYEIVPSSGKNSVTPDMYIALRQSVDWASSVATKHPLEVAKAALKGCWYSCFIRHKGTPNEIVAMGRVIGDGGCSFRIEDVATRKDHQRKRLATFVVQDLLRHIDQNSVAKQGSATMLTTVGPALRGWYESLDFDYPGGKKPADDVVVTMEHVKSPAFFRWGQGNDEIVVARKGIDY